MSQRRTGQREGRKETDVKLTHSTGASINPPVSFIPTPPPGPAHRGFLQHCDVHALPPQTDAVGH